MSPYRTPAEFTPSTDVTPARRAGALTHRVELLINGVAHGGFTGGSITRSLETPASSFELEYSATAGGTGRTWPILAGDEATLLIDDKAVITGYVDRSTRSYDPMRRTYRASGRSKVADLIDCACVRSPRVWTNANLATIASQAATGFACEVAVYGGDRRAVGRRRRPAAPSTPTPAAGAAPAQEAAREYPRFTYRPGEAVIEVIRRAASMRGMHLFDTPEGNLLLARVGADDSGVTLRRGVNVVKAERSEDWSQRFSEYRFKGQSHARDELTGRAGAQLHNEANDPTLEGRGRFRPTIVTKKGGGGERDLGAAAILQRNQTAGRSETYSCTVNGWLDGDDNVWNVGYLAQVEDDWCDISGRMLVTSARLTFAAEGQGYQTDLQLMWPEAFDEANFPTRGRGDMWR